MKNLLADTNYTKGWDHRFGSSVHLGFVSKVEVTDKGANVRVILPDKRDHKDQPLITKPVPVLQVCSKAKRSFAVPRLGTPVAVVKMPTGTSNYFVIGGFYTKNDPPPVTDEMLDYTIYDDGSTMQFDASNGQLDWNLKGDYNFKGDKALNILVQGDVKIDNEGNVIVTPTGDVVIQPDGDVTIQAGTITLQGDVNIIGNITHAGDNAQLGIHEDLNGFHTGARATLERLAALEARVASLEARLQ